MMTLARPLVAIFLFCLVSASGAYGAPALIVVEDNGASNPVEREVSERLGALVVANTLGRSYDHIDLLKGDQATLARLIERIEHRARRRDVDVLILSHGKPGKLLLSHGEITTESLLRAGRLPRLRMVYMMGCHSASLLEAWQKAGARVAIGHQDVNSLPGFFFPRFLRLWSEGKPVKAAVEQAYHYAQQSASRLGSFVKDTSDYLSELGIARSEPVIVGENLDRYGRRHPVETLRIRPVDLHPVEASFAVGAHRHSDFELTAIELANSMIPQVSVSPENIPSAQQFIDRTADLAWIQLGDSFPFPDGLPGAEGLGENERWIDGTLLRFLIEPLREWMGSDLELLADRLQGARLIRGENELQVNVYFDRAFTIQVKPKRETKRWQLYAVEFPPTLRLRFSAWDGRFFVSGFDGGPESLKFKVNMPWLPDAVYLRTASLDLGDGALQVEAGVVGNTLSVLASAHIYAKRFDGVDIWKSIRRNLRLLIVPDLIFLRK